nr:MAG TPA: hypothetical protein [Caudoviricetes sp.]
MDPRWGFCGCWTVRSGKAKSIENRTISKNTNADITNKLIWRIFTVV